MSQQSIRVGSLQLDLPLALAPMVGLSHSGLRSLLLELGGVGLLFTEMLAARRLPHENASLSPMLIRGGQESPLFYQIFLADPAYVNGAVAKLEQIGADGIDLNLGCPAPQLRRSGSGGFLAEDRKLVATLLNALRSETSLPLSAKIRLGHELNRQKLVDFCRMLEDCGVDLITVHARLHDEKFIRPPRWPWISYVKEAVSIPILANGGIFTVEDGKQCLSDSGADGLMLGRGGVENPWLFKEIASAIYGLEIEDHYIARDQLYYRFVELLKQRFAPERQLGRLKQFTHYYARSFTYGHHLASWVQTSNNMEEAVDKAKQFFIETETTELHYYGRKQ